mgnify:CR=1 FL=1
MKILKAFKTELNPNATQLTLLKKAAGAARWAYNWGLAKKKAAMEKKERIPTAIDLHKELNQLKKTEITWMYETSKCAPHEALRNLDKAFNNFFRNCKKKKKGKKGFPRFKSKHKNKDSFCLNGSIHVFSDSIQLPRIGAVRLKERDYIPTDNAKILSATVSSCAGRWFVAVQMEVEIAQLPKNSHTIGVDLGIKTLATCSNGEIFENPKHLKRKEKTLRIRQKSLSRKRKGSANRKKAARKLARLHYRIANARKDYLHKITSKIISENQTIVLEDLNLSGMVKNHKLAKSISDVGMGEFRRQLEYKAKWYGRQVVVVDRYFPSSKTCSSCGTIKEDLKLSERVYKCDCGLQIDRDMNAAINLANTARSAGIQAYGDGSSGRIDVNPVKLLLMN